MSIKLRAIDEDDLKIVSACLQDAIVPIGDMCYQPDEHRFVIVVNRFKWEAADGDDPDDETRPVAEAEVESAGDLFPFERTHTAVRFEDVSAVRTRGIDLNNRAQLLELLSLEPVPEGVILHFAGGGCIRVESGACRVLVEDLGDPWPTGCKPCHAIDGEFQTAV